MHQSRSAGAAAAIGRDDGKATGAAVISPCLRFVLGLSVGCFAPDTYQSAAVQPSLVCVPDAAGACLQPACGQPAVLGSCLS